MHPYLNAVFYRDSRRVDLLLVRALLSGPAVLYRTVTGIRSRLYRSGYFTPVRLEVPVISIGNITVGGTGKTPLVRYIASLLQQRQKKVAVISRGYKGRARGTVVVSEGDAVLAPAAQAGDEPVLLAGKLAGVPVLANKDRAAAGRLACHRFKPDCIILDDGFQHFPVARDVDLLVIDAANPFGNGRLLPRGPLREPLSALARADLIIITKVNQAPDLTGLIRQVRQYATDTPLFKAVYRPGPLTHLGGGQLANINGLSGRRVCLVSGIADPDSFRKTVQELGPDIVEEMTFPDHHRYSLLDVKSIMTRARRQHAECILTTEKDAVRLPPIKETSLPFYSVDLEVSLVEGSGKLLALLLPDRHNQIK